MEWGNIKEISITELYGHPKNPRKNIGDVTELADSIKEKGLMQNLTVVPGHYLTGDEIMELNKRYKEAPTEELRVYIQRHLPSCPTQEKSPDGYTVIIGHRRLAAAKKAGLQTVPCVIREDMTEKEQIATMIAENMQRVDLTVVEQAQSIQLMLDLGDTVEQVSKKTGLSQTTVRNRLKIAQLDAVALKQSEARQITIGDYMKIMEIEDDSTRNIVLASAGTNNFAREYEKAIKAQTEKSNSERIEKYLQNNRYVYIQDDQIGDKVFVKTLWSIKPEDNLDKVIGKPQDGAVYYNRKWGAFSIYRDRNESDDRKKEENQKMQSWHKAKEREIEEIQNGMYGRMKEFVNHFSPKSGDADLIRNAFALRIITGFSPKNEKVAGILDLEEPEDAGYGYDFTDELQSAYVQNPVKTMLAYIVEDIYHNCIAEVTWSQPYTVETYRLFTDQSRKRWLRRAEILEELGFDLADEERDFVNGTHKLYGQKYEEEK